MRVKIDLDLARALAAQGIDRPAVLRALRCAAHGVEDRRVKVTLLPDRNGFTHAHLQVHASDYTIAIYLATMSKYGHHWVRWLWNTSRFDRPLVPIETALDAVIMASVPEFRRLGWWHRHRHVDALARVPPPTQVEAERFALRRLSAWREATGREPFHEKKRPPPAHLTDPSVVAKREAKRALRRSKAGRTPVPLARFVGLGAGDAE